MGPRHCCEGKWYNNTAYVATEFNAYGTINWKSVIATTTGSEGSKSSKGSEGMGTLNGTAHINGTAHKYAVSHGAAYVQGNAKLRGDWGLC